MPDLRQTLEMARQAKGGNVFVFRQDEVSDSRVVGIVAGEAGDGRSVLAEVDVRARHRMPFNGMIELVSFVKVQVDPGIHFLEWDRGAPRKSESVRLAVHFH
jgi:hypothetical protein